MKAGLARPPAATVVAGRHSAQRGQNKAEMQLHSLQSQVDDSAVTGKLAQLQRRADHATLQLMKWPRKKNDQPGPPNNQWEDDFKSLWEWAGNRDEYDYVAEYMSVDLWNTHKDKLRASLASEFATAVNEVDKTFITYLRSQKKAAPVKYQDYKASDHVFPSGPVAALLQKEGVALPDLEKYQHHLEVVKIHDLAYAKESWEKDANAKTQEDRIAYNQRADIEKQAIIAQLALFKEDKRLADEQAARLQAHNQGVASVTAHALNVQGFAAVLGNPLAKSAWDAMVANAGKTGYLAVNGIHPRNDVTAATALLRTFSFAWVGSNPPDFMKNPNVPGQGLPEDKSVKDNYIPGQRESKYQANFIATWDGNKTVIHISSDSD